MQFTYTDWKHGLIQMGLANEVISEQAYNSQVLERRAAEVRLKEIMKDKPRSTARMNQGMGHLAEALAA